MAEPEMQAICEFLCYQAQTSPQPTISGSTLGSALQIKFPDLNIKARFGGLKRFIEGNCAGDLIWLRKHGGDDIYAHKSRVQSACMEPASDVEPLETWRAFSHPKSWMRLAVEKSTGKISIFPQKAALPEGFVEIPRMTATEHREISSGFLNEIDASDKEQLAEALKSVDFWPQWSALISAHKADGLFTQWLLWRKQRIAKLLRERLEAAGISTDSSERTVQTLTSHKRSVSPKKLEIPRMHLPAESGFDSPLRKVVHSAVDLMGEDELRRISIPVGIVIDALRGTRH